MYRTEQFVFVTIAGEDPNIRLMRPSALSRLSVTNESVTDTSIAPQEV
jgi:hypothetical protein